MFISLQELATTSLIDACATDMPRVAYQEINVTYRCHFLRSNFVDVDKGEGLGTLEAGRRYEDENFTHDSGGHIAIAQFAAISTNQRARSWQCSGVATLSLF